MVRPATSMAAQIVWLPPPPLLLWCLHRLRHFSRRNVGSPLAGVHCIFRSLVSKQDGGAYIKYKGSTLSLQLHTLAQKIILWSSTRFMFLCTTHITGLLNRGVDLLSTGNHMYGEWSLHPIWQRFGWAAVEDLFHPEQVVLWAWHMKRGTWILNSVDNSWGLSSVSARISVNDGLLIRILLTVGWSWTHYWEIISGMGNMYCNGVTVVDVGPVLKFLQALVFRAKKHTMDTNGRRTNSPTETQRFSGLISGISHNKFTLSYGPILA